MYKKHRRLCALSMSLCFLLSVSGSSTYAADAIKAKPSPQTLESLVRKLIDLQVEEQAETSAWTEQKAHLLSMQEALRKEQALLQKKLTALTARKEEAATERDALRARLQAAQKQATALEQTIQTTAKKLQNIHTALPAPLQQPLEMDLRPLQALTTGKGPSQLSARMRIVTAFLGKLQKTMSAVHACKEVLSLEDGVRREVDVLYLGGAIGYYVSADDQFAGVLQRSKETWRPRPLPSLAASIRHALAVTRKDLPPALVSLPLNAEDNQ